MTPRTRNGATARSCPARRASDCDPDADPAAQQEGDGDLYAVATLTLRNGRITTMTGPAEMTAPTGGPVPEDEGARDPMLERLDPFVGEWSIESRSPQG